MRPALWAGKTILAIIMAALMVTAVSLGSQKADPPKAAVPAAIQKLPSIWVSQTTKHEFRVTIEKDLFRAEWINIPPAPAKQGAYIRSECRRSGSKWIGTSSVYLPCVVPDKPSGDEKNTCHITLRFEVDSLTPTKITGRGETLQNFDCGKCQVLKTGWGDFVWVPKGK